MLTKSIYLRLCMFSEVHVYKAKAKRKISCTVTKKGSKGNQEKVSSAIRGPGGIDKQPGSKMFHFTTDDLSKALKSKLVKTGPSFLKILNETELKETNSAHANEIEQVEQPKPVVNETNEAVAHSTKLQEEKGRWEEYLLVTLEQSAQPLDPVESFSLKEIELPPTDDCFHKGIENSVEIKVDGTLFNIEIVEEL